MEKTMSICPKCKSLNNVDTSKALNNESVCGRCGSSLEMHSLVTMVDGKDFRRIINKANKPVIVDFWASWCGPCQVYGPEFEKASLHNTNAIFLKVNTEENPELSQQLGIRGIPATIVFKNGKEVRRQAGSMQAEDVAKLIDER